MIKACRVVLLLTLVILGSAFAQTPELPLGAISGTDKTAEFGSIPVGDLPRRVLEENLYLQNLVQRHSPAARTETLDQELAGIKSSVDALGEKILGRDFDTLPLSGLEALERHLQFLDGKLVQLQDDLLAGTRPLSESAGELARRRKIWLETRQSAAEIVSPGLLNSIDELNSEFLKAANEASRPLSSLLNLNHEASALHERVGNSLSSVRNRIGSIGDKLWSVDSDNLLAAIRNARPKDESNVPAVVNGFAVQADFIKAFDQAAKTKHTILAIFALLTLPVFIYLSRWARGIVGSDRTLEYYRKTLGRPVSAWLLFVIMCLLIVDFNGPWFQLRLLLALAWLPVMRLQPAWIVTHLGRWIYATALFFGISFVCQLITTLPVDYRVTLLANGVLLLATLAWLLYRLARGEDDHDSRPRLVARTLIAAHLATIGCAIITNLVGSVQMATLLTEASLNSLYLALFLCAVRELVHAYARTLINSGAARIRTRAQHASRLFEVAFTLVNLVLALIWLLATLNSLRVLGPLKSVLYAVADFKIEFGSISITIGGIVLFCASVFLSFWIAKTIRSVLREDVLPNMTLPRGVANSVATMSYYLLLMLGLLVALTAAGFQLSQLALVVGALSVGIGFGLNTVINNFVCGLILMVERPIQPGDTVELSGTIGRIRDIGIRTTTLTTFDGADVLVPNGLLLSEKLVNWTLNNNRRRIEVPVGVAYNCAPREVQSLLLAVAKRTEGISHDPLPAALFMGFGESSLDFVVRAWTDNLDQAQAIRSEMAIDIHATLKEAGIEIPFPQRDLHIRATDPGIEKPEAGLARIAEIASPAQELPAPASGR